MKFLYTIKQLEKFTNFAVESAQLELGTTRKIRGKNVRRVASGGLKDSLFGYRTMLKGKFRIEFGSVKAYSIFVHEGVNGTVVNNGSKFSFKSKNIGWSQEEFDRWARFKKIRPKDKNGQFVKVTPSAMAGMRFAIGRSMAKKGIVGVPFFTKGIERSMKKFDKDIATALAKDSINFLD